MIKHGIVPKILIVVKKRSPAINPHRLSALKDKFELHGVNQRTASPQKNPVRITLHGQCRLDDRIYGTFQAILPCCGGKS